MQFTKHKTDIIILVLLTVGQVGIKHEKKKKKTAGLDMRNMHISKYSIIYVY